LAPPPLPARRVLQLGERGFCPGGKPFRTGVQSPLTLLSPPAYRQAGNGERDGVRG